MPNKFNNIELIIQYSLLVAGEEDALFERQLGPIHLIKYVYLADLYYAKRNRGETFTNVNWQFYKFGPWSQSVNEAIEPALRAISANKKSFESNYGEDDWIRWSLTNESLLRDKERLIPACITTYLKLDIHRHGKDTPSLLDFVYRTPPMLFAAPNEFLDFSLAIPVEKNKTKEPPKLRLNNLSNKKKKKFLQEMKSIREKHKANKVKKPELVNPINQARFDDIYEGGVAWLDGLSGNKFKEKKITVKFDDDVWKSKSRNSDELL